MTYKEHFIGRLLFLIPKNFLSYWVGKLVHLRLPPPLGLWTVRWFAIRYRINLQEAELPIGSYLSIGELFTRKLRPGLRPSKGDVVHPADSSLTQRGKIEKGLLFQVKGLSYLVEDFLSDPDASAKWGGGHYLTYYLCPTDYHRVHSPVHGFVKSIKYIPGNLWPVNNWSVNHIAKLFARNERLIFNIQTQRGTVALVMVGATNVGKMSVSFDPELQTNQCTSRQIIEKNYDPPQELNPGEELGIFHMGSTVVMLYPPGFFRSEIKPGEPVSVRVGEELTESL